VEVEVFNLFVHWLYAQSLPEMPKQSALLVQVAKANVTPPNKMLDYAGTLLFKAIVFGDRFLAAGFPRLAYNTYVGS
jgi:hypothetical protein